MKLSPMLIIFSFSFFGVCLELNAEDSFEIKITSEKYSPAETAMRNDNNRTKQSLTISQTTNDGHYVTLSDGSKYEVYPDDREISAGWLVPADVVVRSRRGNNYPFSITNEWTNTSIRARLMETPDRNGTNSRD